MVTEKNKEIKILYVYNHNRSFVQGDLKILSNYFDVFPFFYKKRSTLEIPKLVKQSDFVFCWFASYHSILPVYYAKKYSKKSIVVAGGYDVANEPTIRYGLSTKIYTKWIPKYVLDRASKILAVSNHNLEETKRITKNKNVELLYNGIDVDRYQKVEQRKKEDMVITVGFLDKSSWKRKGIDKFIETAMYFPDTQFTVIGKLTDFVEKQKKHAPSNVTFTGYVSDEELRDYYQRAKVYAQFSFYESFGMAVAEAMMCNCIPVVSNRGGLPEVAGDTGLKVDYDIDSFVGGIKRALEMPFSTKPREHIIDMFSLEKRKNNLLTIIEGMKR